MKHKVIVFGASGATGVKICEALAKFNIEHTAFVRKGSETKLTTPASKIYFGEVLNYDDVEKALKSDLYSDVIIALGSHSLKDDSIRSKGTENIVTVLNNNQINAKVHAVSANGVGESANGLSWFNKLIVRLFLKNAMKDHEKQEGIVETNPGGYHIVRPVGLRNYPAKGNVCSDSNGKVPKNVISREDVAEYIVNSMLQGIDGKHSISNC